MRRGVGLEPREAWRCSTRFGLPKRVPLYFTGPWSLLLALALAVPRRACSEFARPPVLFLLAPTDGEVVSSLPIVLSYRVMGVDSVEIYCDGRLQYRHDADRDEDRATTALITNFGGGQGFLLSGMHSVVVTGKRNSEEQAVIGQRVDFFADMPCPWLAGGVRACEPVLSDHARAFQDDTGIGTVLLVGARGAHGLAAQYKLAMERLGVFVHTLEEQYSDASVLSHAVMLHTPDLVLYLPEQELIGASAAAR